MVATAMLAGLLLGSCHAMRSKYTCTSGSVATRWSGSIAPPAVLLDGLTRPL